MRHLGSRLVVLVAVLALVVAACGDDSSDDASGDSGSDTVAATDVWARSTAEGQANGAVYMTLTGGDEDDALVGAAVSGDVAAVTEIHETVMSDDEMSDDEMSDDDDMDGMGAMTMQEVASIEVPAGGTAVLEPGGYHVMLLDLADGLEAGDEFELTLTFESGEELQVTVEVRDS